jgi:phage FluMu protein Com
MHRNLETTNVPLELRPGMSVPIPCRHCEKSLIRFTISEGAHSVTCSRCNCATDVKVYAEGPAYRIKTSKGAVRVKPTSS